MHARTRCAALVSALLLTASAAAAQEPGYRFSAGDTLRYRERTESRLELNGSGGETVIPITHEAVVAMAPAAEGVEAWFDSLALTVRVRGATRRLYTDAAVGQRFQLHVSAQGRVEVLDAPVFPADLAAFSDLTKEFQDFLVTLPEQGLGEAAQWSELVELDPTADGPGFRANRTYRVLGDTVVNGQRGWVIAMTQQIRQQITRPSNGGQAVSVLQGEERGTAVFSAETGRMLIRRKEATLRGTLTMVMGARRIEVPQTFGYRHTLQLID